MAADLHLHIRTSEVTDELIADFFGHCLGSKFFDIDRQETLPTLDDIKRHPNWKWLEKDFDENGNIRPGAYVPGLAHIVISDTPNIWVGEVSWLKAALFEDPNSFIPDPIGAVREIFEDDEGTEITDEIIQKVQDALVRPNQTGYSISEANPVIEFLKKYKGERAFTISW